MVFAAITGCVLTARGTDDSDQSEFPQITAQPTDQGVDEGSSTTFTVGATNGDLAYQWLRNGAVMDGQTNSSLALENVGTNDVALYSCNVAKGTEVVPTRAASLSVAVATASGFTIYTTPVTSSGSSGTCPGAYAGYAIYTKSVANGWGWAPTSGATVHTASDTTRSDTKVTYSGRYGDAGCAQTTVTVPHPTSSPKYRFTIYFPNNVPTGTYPLTLSGFDP
jgi:hypothetical protein